MKRILGSIFATIFIVLLTGCGESSSKTLSCSKDYSDSMPSGIELTQSVDVKFSNNKISSIDMVMKFTLDEDTSEKIDTYVSSMQSTYDSEYGSYDGVTVTTEKTSDTEFNVTINIDYQNLSDDDKSSLNLSGSETYSDNKTSFENNGYTCK